MRISECAELTGTTVRYHRIGLWIRWLAEAGLSPDAVADRSTGPRRSG